MQQRTLWTSFALALLPSVAAAQLCTQEIIQPDTIGAPRFGITSEMPELGLVPICRANVSK